MQVVAFNFRILFLEQLGLPANLPIFSEQIDEYVDLRTQDIGLDRFDDVINCAQRIATAQMPHTGTVGSQENDRRLARSLAAANQLGRLESIDARHVNVQQNHGGFVVE